MSWELSDRLAMLCGRRNPQTREEARTVVGFAKRLRQRRVLNASVGGIGGTAVWLALSKLFGDGPSAVALVSAVVFGLAFFGALVLVTSVRSRHLEERGRQALPNGPDGLGAS